MEGIPFSVKAINELFRDNFKYTPKSSVAMVDRLKRQAARLGLEDPDFALESEGVFDVLQDEALGLEEL